MMELHSILILASILSFIILLTYFMYARQQKSHKKNVVKQEPRFDLVPNSPLEYTEPEEVNNLLIDDPLLMPVKVPEQKSEPENIKTNKPTVDEVIYIIIGAKPNKPYVGYELLQALLAAGLRFGAMNLFHRYEDLQGKGKILFSLASASEQGSFEINKMGAFVGKGLILFLSLTHNKDLTSAFEIMLETARQLVEDLDGELLDDERKPLNLEKIEKIKSIIYEYEQKQLIGDLFDS